MSRFIVFLSAIAFSVSSLFGDTQVRLGSLGKNDTVVTDISDTTNRLSNVENQTASIARLVMGESVILESTNYNSKVNIPTLSVKFKLKDEETGSNYWYTVWNEMGWVNYFLDRYLPTNFYYKAEIDSMLDQKADRAWGFYDSHTGEYAPDGFTWISSPNIAIAGNLSYQRVVTSAGAVFVLCNNGMTTLFGTDTGTNGWLRICDDEGKALFEITKGTESTEGANAAGISVYTGGADGLPHLVVPYKVSARPTLKASKDLKTWKEQGAEDTYINVNWTSEVSGDFVADVANLTGTAPLFIKATYKVGASDMVKNFAPLSVEGGIYCEDGETLIVPYIDGGEVKWKIKTN